MNEQANGQSRETPFANCDQEAWIQDRVLTAMCMAIVLFNQKRVAADDSSLQYGLRGIAEGTAAEIIFTSGMRPSMVNIRPYQSVFSFNRLDR